MRPKCPIEGCRYPCKFKSFTKRGQNYYSRCGKHLNMMTLDEMVKEQLEAKLDEHFPKGNANRGAGLVIMAEAYLICRATIKSFGGCTKCFGKGYGTQTLYARGRGESDMGTGDVVVDKKLPTMVFCSCDRGQQLEKLWNI